MFVFTVSDNRSLKDRLSRFPGTWPEISEDQLLDCSMPKDAEVAAELLHFDDDPSTMEVIARLTARGMRTANIDELLAFIATFRQVQRVAQLGTVWHDSNGRPVVAYSDTNDFYEQVISTWRPEHGWGPCWLFLAIYTDPPKPHGLIRRMLQQFDWRVGCNILLITMALGFCVVAPLIVVIVRWMLAL